MSVKTSVNVKPAEEKSSDIQIMVKLNISAITSDGKSTMLAVIKILIDMITMKKTINAIVKMLVSVAMVKEKPAAFNTVIK